MAARRSRTETSQRRNSLDAVFDDARSGCLTDSLSRLQAMVERTTARNVAAATESPTIPSRRSSRTLIPPSLRKVGAFDSRPSPASASGTIDSLVAELDAASANSAELLDQVTAAKARIRVSAPQHFEDHKARRDSVEESASPTRLIPSFSESAHATEHVSTPDDRTILRNSACPMHRRRKSILAATVKAMQAKDQAAQLLADSMADAKEVEHEHDDKLIAPPRPARSPIMQSPQLPRTVSMMSPKAGCRWSLGNGTRQQRQVLSMRGLPARRR